MRFGSFQEIMDYAVEKEREAAAFYEEASAKEIYSGARETLQAFAKEERKHESLLKNFTEENLALYRAEKIPDLKRSDYLVDMKYEPGMSYPDLLRLAMKREEKAFKFYSDFGAQARNEGHKKLFATLAQEESKHKFRLESLLDDYLAQVGD